MFCILIYSSFSFAQKQKSNYIFNEFGISGNYSVAVSKRYTTHSSLGGGVSIYKSFRDDSPIKTVGGIDYNFTHFEIDSIRSDYGQYYTEARFRYNQFRIPFSVRFHVGKTKTFFMEPGIFLNILYSSTLIGISHTPTLGGEMIESQKVRLDPDFGLGFSFGVGIQLPVKSGSLIVRVDVNKGFSYTSLAPGSASEQPLFYNSYLRLAVIYRLGDFMKKQE